MSISPKANTPLSRMICYYAGLAGIWAICVLEAILLISAWLRYAWIEPEAFSGNWPTMSRVLADGPFFHTRLLGGLSGLGFVAGGVAIAAMMHKRAQIVPIGQAWGFRIKQFLGMAAASLGIVQYFLITRTLTRDLESHMLLSYTFFVGSTSVVLIDLLISARMRRLYKLPDHLLLSPKQRRICSSSISAGIFFLATFIAKDLDANPWPLLTQHIFVLCELIWLATTPVYLALYIPQLRDHFLSDAASFNEAFSQMNESNFAHNGQASCYGQSHVGTAKSSG
jgi:hypothetical protein